MTRAIYEGSRSVYALREGMYAEGHGVNLRSGVTILYFLLRDLRRGWTYNKYGQRIPMTEELFRARARYLYPLCVKHTNTKECDVLKQIIEYAIMYHRLPEWAKHYVSIGYAKKVPLKVPIVGVAPRAYVNFRRRLLYAYA